MIETTAEGYWAPGELEDVRCCPACGSPASEYRYQDLLDHLEGVPGHWGFRHCHGCDSLFLDPRPTPDAIGKAYSSSSYFTHQSGALAHAADAGDSLAWRLANGYLNSRFGCHRTPASRAGKWLIPLLLPVRQQLDYFYRHLPRAPGSILDVGCGNGAFLLRAAEAGWKVQGVEPDTAAAMSAENAGLPIHRGDLSNFIAPRAFDVVTLSHVFEHLHDPRFVLARCLQLLRPGGMLWMSLPNVQGLGHRAYGKAWFPLDPPRHLLLPSRSQLTKLCQEAGFIRVSILRRGRSGASGMNECAARATKLGVTSAPGWLWHHVINLLSTASPRWSEELILVGFKVPA